MKTLLIIAAAFILRIGANDSKTITFYTDNKSKIVTEMTLLDMQKSHDLSFKLPFDSLYWKYDRIYIEMRWYEKLSTEIRGQQFISYYKDHRKYDKSYKLLFGEQDGWFYIINPKPIENKSNAGLIGNKWTTYEGDFCNEGQMFTLKSNGELKQPCSFKIIIHGTVKTGTKQQWNSSDNSYYTVDVFATENKLYESSIFYIK